MTGPRGARAASPTTEHHVWCTYAIRPRAGCPRCKVLYAQYPMEGLTLAEMLDTYFPDAQAR